jgi:hypothetical protein
MMKINKSPNEVNNNADVTIRKRYQKLTIQILKPFEGEKNII